MTRRDRFGSTRLIALAVSVLAVGLSVPPMRSLIEQSMVWHMAVQIPMLLLGGWWSMRAVSYTRAAHRLDPWNRYGLTGFIAAQVIVAYWMLPLAIDRAVVLPQADGLKLLTLFTCGAMLKHSFERAPAVLQLFFVGYMVSMMIWLGLYFATTELRLCNAYLLQSQMYAGRTIVVLAIVTGCAWLVGTIRQVQGSRHLRPSTT